MKMLSFILTSVLAISAFAQGEFKLTSKTVLPTGEEYPCEASADLYSTKDGYALIYAGEYQTAGNPGEYFQGVNKGRICVKSETTGTECSTVTGTEAPIALEKDSCTTLLPINCVKTQQQHLLTVNADGTQLTLTYKNLQGGGVQSAVCVYQK